MYKNPCLPQSLRSFCLSALSPLPPPIHSLHPSLSLSCFFCTSLQSLLSFYSLPLQPSVFLLPLSSTTAMTFLLTLHPLFVSLTLAPSMIPLFLLPPLYCYLSYAFFFFPPPCFSPPPLLPISPFVLLALTHLCPLYIPPCPLFLFFFFFFFFFN